MTEWQPIETAPKDGQGVLLFIPEHGDGHESDIWLGYWEIDAWEGCPLGDVQPTHWMSLPEPPK